MKHFTDYIFEGFKINSDSIKRNKEKEKERYSSFNNVEIHNEVDCKALPSDYVDAIIEAFLKSPLKKDVIKINVTDAQSFFDHDFDGKKAFEGNKQNYAYLYNKAYPAMSITYKGNNNKHGGIPRQDTVMSKMPSIHMPLILNDSEGLYTKANSSNMTGVRDVENAYVAFNSTGRHIGKAIQYTMTIIYIIKPKATEKLLPIDIFKQNLLNYYKLGNKEKKEHLEKIDKDFYIDSLRNNKGWLELTQERHEECYKHIKDTWSDEKQAELWKWSQEQLKKIKI